VTGDRDLLELEDIGVAVVTPRELVEELAEHA
jgi:predicted nucleic acid-binding protein